MIGLFGLQGLNNRESYFISKGILQVTDSETHMSRKSQMKERLRATYNEQAQQLIGPENHKGKERLRREECNFFLCIVYKIARVFKID